MPLIAGAVMAGLLGVWMASGALDNCCRDKDACSLVCERRSD